MTQFKFDKTKVTPIQGVGKTVNTDEKVGEMQKMDTTKEVDTVDISKDDLNSALEIVKGGETIIIPVYEFLFKRDHNGTKDKYRIMGIGGSILVNEQELDHIYNRFKELID